MLGAPVRESLEKQTGSRCSNVFPLSVSVDVGTYRVELADTRQLFLKWRRSDPEPLVAEKTGLDLLATAESGLVIPGFLAFDLDNESGAYLAIDWLKPAPTDSQHWTEFGRGLARLHKHVSDRYGFASDNFIGLSPQQNGWSIRWSQFFLECRLEPQVTWAQERGRWSSGWDRWYASLAARIDEILPGHPGASLLHGDLWSGNAMATSSGPAIFDPAVYYGHREADLAMTRLFGGFAAEFYDAYDSVWPLEAGYEERFDVYNLYHLINHLNIFGATYATSVERILKRFAS